jgi:hypothetical protein
MASHQSGSITSTVRRVLHEGNIRRLVVRKPERVLVDLPLTIVIIATVIAPWLVGLGLVAGVITGHSISMVKTEPAAPPEAEQPAPEPFASASGTPDAPAPEGSIDAPE